MSQPQPPSYIQGWSLTFYYSLATLIVSLFIMLVRGFNEPALLQVLSFTARASMYPFFMAFAASGLYLFWPNAITRWMRQQRRYLGVSFAVTFIIHGTAIVLRLLFYPDSFLAAMEMETIDEMINSQFFVVGGFGFVAAFLMAITSNRWSQQRLGPLWKVGHWFGNYYILLQFVAGEIMRTQLSLGYLPYLLMMITVILLRIAGRTQWLIHKFQKLSPASAQTE